MRRYLRKISIMVLIMALFVAQMSTAAFASSTETNYGTQVDLLLKDYSFAERTAMRDKVEEDLFVIEKMGILFSGAVVEILYEQNNGAPTFRYVVDFGTITNTVEVIENNEDMFTVRCVEGDKVDVLSKSKDGTLFLDGEEIIIEQEMPPAFARAGNVGGITPYATETWFQKKSPYGSASDYNYLLTTLNYNKTEVKFNKAIRYLTVSAFTSAMASSIAAWAGIGPIGEFAIGEVLSALVDIDGDVSAVSYKARVYTHKNYTSGYIAPIIMRVWKYQYQYYASPNLTGPYTTNYEFKCQI